MFPTLLLPRRTYIDEFVIAAKKSRFWIDCIPKIEILAFNHVGEIIYRDRFCNIFPIFWFICAFLWFNCICFLGLCLLRVWILKKINKNLTKKLKKNVPVELGKVLLLMELDVASALVQVEQKNLLSLVFVLDSVSSPQNHKLLHLKKVKYTECTLKLLFRSDKKRIT